MANAPKISDGSVGCDEVNMEDAYSFVPTPPPGKQSVYAITADKWNLFFETLAETGVTRKACRKAGVSVFAVHYHSYKSPLFALRMKICRELGAEALEAEAFRRAVDGIKRDIFWQGGVCGTETVYSDALLMFLLKGSKPEKYKDRVASENINLNTDVKANDAKDAELRARIAQKLLKDDFLA